MTQHTPGPWEIEATTLSICRLLVSVEDVNADAINSKKGCIAYVPTDYRTSEQHANARLIAAAPKLLKLTQEALDWAEDDAALTLDTVARRDDWRDVLQARAIALRAAITEATGKAGA